MFYDSIESHIRGLRSLGKSEHSYGNLLVQIIMDKLPMDIVRFVSSTPEGNLQDPYTTDFKGSTTAAFQVGVKDTRDRSAKKMGTTYAFCKWPHSTHSTIKNVLR